MTLKEGVIIAEHYQLIRQLGHGSFGDVWLAHNLLADIDVAIKFYGTFDQKGLEDFRNEFKIAYRLRHPSLLNINHFDVYDNCPYLVMPYCQNGSASRYVGQMPESEIWKFILDVSGGIAYLHSQQPPIIHQDIKPDNILITAEGRYVITDFGISRTLRSMMSRTNNTPNTSGTIAYMGPERFSEKPMVVLASDIWAFGMTVFELMTGDVLWEGMGGSVQLSGARLPIIGDNFSQALKNLVKSCLSAETWNRPTAFLIQEYVTAYMQKKPLPPLPGLEAEEPTGKSDINREPIKDPIHPEPTPPRPPISGPTPPPTTGSTPASAPNKNVKRILLVAAAILSVIILASGAVKVVGKIIEEQSFVSCRTKQDYEQFLKDYPESSFAETARERIGELSPKKTAVPVNPTAAPVSPTVPSQPLTEIPKQNNKQDPTPITDSRKSKQPQPTITYVTEKSNINQQTPATNQQEAGTSGNVNVMNNDDRDYFRCATASDYNNYLRKYPKGKHRNEASIALNNLLNQVDNYPANDNQDIPNADIPNSNRGRMPMPRNDVPNRSRVSISIGQPVGGRPHIGSSSGPRSGGQRDGGQRSVGSSSHRHSN